jgi:predicted nuclease of predicted toxin-antitoxin system
MKLLLDENLSRRLVEAIRDLFPGSVHVTQVGLSSGTPDRRIWDYAQQNGFAILTADTDFVTLANTLGSPPKIILLEHCDYPTNFAAQVMRANASQISKFEHSRTHSSFCENNRTRIPDCPLRSPHAQGTGWHIIPRMADQRPQPVAVCTRCGAVSYSTDQINGQCAQVTAASAAPA